MTSRPAPSTPAPDPAPAEPKPSIPSTPATPSSPGTSEPTDSTRAPLGVNLEGLWDWARLQPFVDIMKSSRPWGSADEPWDEAAATDAKGWPTGDAGVVVNVRTFEPGDEDKPYRYMTAGVYKLRFTGRATVSLNSSPDVELRNVKYDSASDRTDAEIVVGPDATQLMLSFRDTTNGVRNVSVLRPGYSEDQTFTNQFADALKPFQVVRFMDFLRTNDNPVSTWSERTTTDSATQSSAKGAAYEYAIQVANELNKDIWINIPFKADAAYVRSLAELLKKNLSADRAVYVEYSNELWNTQFTQTGENTKAAVAEAIAGDTTLTKGAKCTQAQFDEASGDCNPYWAGYYRVGKRAVDVAKTFSDVFGAAAMNKQVRIVYATQFANPGIAEEVLANIAEHHGKPSSLLYGVATAPYFYLAPDLVGSDSASVDQVIDSLRGSLTKDTEPFFAAGIKEGGAFVRKAYTGAKYSGASHKALADYYGIKSLAYEGGNDLGQNAANHAVKLAANHDPRMGELLKAELGQWLGCGNDLFMYFSLSSPWDRYGYWGLTNDPTNLKAPKYAAASEIAQSERADFKTCR